MTFFHFLFFLFFFTQYENWKKHEHFTLLRQNIFLSFMRPKNKVYNHVFAENTGRHIKV